MSLQTVAAIFCTWTNSSKHDRCSPEKDIVMRFCDIACLRQSRKDSDIDIGRLPPAALSCAAFVLSNSKVIADNLRLGSVAAAQQCAITAWSRVTVSCK